jgi:hypothetical protein
MRPVTLPKGVVMTLFARELTAAVRSTLSAIKAARAAGDDYLVQAMTDRLEDLRRIARNTEVTVEG